MGTNYELSTLIGKYLDALGEAGRLEADGLIDEARKQRETAASLCAAIEHGWPLEDIKAACKQQTEAILADCQSAHEQFTAQPVLRRAGRRAHS